ncbi:MAG: dinitrogenase iron-molybdenum cofactor biosynthesis protein [Bacteroidia bacterium]|nr:dinitrogenase iron-molybdenum cofactor biosynthesis protein [Bacteroidia bacterium]
MKIAITSEGNSLNSLIDPRFGRCSFFAIYDTDTKNTEFILNPVKESLEGAGPAAVQFIASKEVKKIVAGEFGGKIKSLLDNLKIDMLKDNGKTISEIIKQF